MAQSPSPSILPVSKKCGDKVVANGCVGACGSSYSLRYLVTPADVPRGEAQFCLASTKNSLCASNGAIATLSKNTGRKQKGNLSKGDVLMVMAKAGDVLHINVVDTVVNPGIVCVQQGETQFALKH